METAILLIQCPDMTGIVAKLSNCVFENKCNITRSDQHSTDAEGGRFFMRLEFMFQGGEAERKDLEGNIGSIAEELNAEWNICYTSDRLSMGILVSKQDHCLYDLLYRQSSGELAVDIPLVISNHEKVRDLVEHFQIPFHHIPVSRESKMQSEAELLELVKDKTDFLVLARYMQIISDGFLGAYGREIINIHHSFLPSFKGANPYKQAYDRGVKIIGATAHYVSADLDEGPIIAQEVERVSPKDGVADLKRKGKNLEKVTLANAVHAHIQRRIIRHSNKTIVFE